NINELQTDELDMFVPHDPDDIFSGILVHGEAPFSALQLFSTNGKSICFDRSMRQCFLQRCAASSPTRTRFQNETKKALS
ncbi:MAG: hypothetical protein II010_06095, partial [Oscillospiraceae bacterium]|nr:hypothetical protein [Oscillospiraceae bacterium]